MRQRKGGRERRTEGSNRGAHEEEKEHEQAKAESVIHSCLQFAPLKMVKRVFIIQYTSAFEC